MAETDTATAPAATRTRKSRKRLLAVVLVVLVAAGGGLYATGMVGAAAEEAPAAAAPAEGAVVPLATMTASIGKSTPGYVRVGIALVLAEGVTPEAVGDRFPLVQDATLSELSEHEPDALRTPEGIETLRRELGDRARAVYPDGEVLRVVLTELLVQ